MSNPWAAQAGAHIPLLLIDAISSSFNVIFLWYSSIFYIYVSEQLANDLWAKLFTHLIPKIAGKLKVSYNDWEINIGVFRNGNKSSANIQFYIWFGCFKTHYGTGMLTSEFAIISKFLILFLNVSYIVWILTAFKKTPLSE